MPWRLLHKKQFSCDFNVSSKSAARKGKSVCSEKVPPMSYSLPKAAFMGHGNLWGTILRMSCSSIKTKIPFYLWDQRFFFFYPWGKVSHLSVQASCWITVFQHPHAPAWVSFSQGLQVNAASLHALHELQGKSKVWFIKIHPHHSLTKEFQPKTKACPLSSPI